MRRRGSVALCLVIGLASSGCTGGGRQAAPALPPSESVREWVGVLETGTADDMEQTGADVRARAPEAGVVSPLGCWPELADQLGGDRIGEYVVAVVAPTRAEVEAAVSDTGREAIFVGELRTDCDH